eukprot:scaffold30588_cov129-Isochrysis_galbana.AAC.6
MMPEDREPNAPDMPHADTRTPLHGRGPTGGVPSDKALSDRLNIVGCEPAVFALHWPQATNLHAHAPLHLHRMRRW